MTDARRALPSVGRLLDSPALRPLLSRSPRALVIDVIRILIDNARIDPDGAPSTEADWVGAVEAQVAARELPSLRPVFNGTGVVLHTNLGRAPLAAAAIDAIRSTAEGYATLEYDLARGERGSRMTHCVDLLRELTGADAALVVNNCAAALVLALDTFASDRSAIVSRGELIEIGGSFRVPDIMAKSGARLVEVGTTNRTHLDDYRKAIDNDTGAIVKVHRSNFVVGGFVAEASAEQLHALARDTSLPLIHDFGSGLMLPLDEFGLQGELTAREVATTATVVLMSGDKLFGGPQAGIILGEREAVDRMARNPLARALRVDKMTIAALGATLMLYRDPTRALKEIPILAMLTATAPSVRSRCDAIANQLRTKGIDCSVVPTEGSVGGGAFPTARIPSAAIAFTGSANDVERRLRSGRMPVITRVLNGAALIDLRTIPPKEDDALRAAIESALRARSA